ncbi:hypothetical protein [Halalkalibacter urbisdiaboli]|uniref:hypothetical protein n=1 Tax=Halalkalibacter urbisdiaboli TaxID=1960589 RepID=UPI000B44365D|nr:hypothetical protein [Halalkalibacter urbisdiaboli]
MEVVEDMHLTYPNGHKPQKENLGVANIPDYLGGERKTDYFLNNVGLHINTVKRTLEAAGFDSDLIKEVESKMNMIYEQNTRNQ